MKYFALILFLKGVAIALIAATVRGAGSRIQSVGTGAAAASTVDIYSS